MSVNQKAQNKPLPSITTLARAAGVTVATYARGKIKTGTLVVQNKIRSKNPKTWGAVRYMARRSGYPIGLVLQMVNFYPMMQAESWKQLSLFQRLVQRITRLFGRLTGY